MKTLSVLILATALLTHLTGCGQDHTATYQALRKSKKEPALKTDPDQFLIQKYKKLLLFCELRLQHSSTFDQNATPLHGFGWNLLTNFTHQKSFELTATVDDQAVRYKIDLQFMGISHSVRTALANGKKYKINDTPVFQIEVKDLHLTSMLYEKLPNQLIMDTVPQSGDSLPYFTQVRCLLDSEANPGYEKDFREL